MCSPRWTLSLAAALLLLAACGDDDGGAAAADDLPAIVVTTSILGDVVSEIVGDDAEVTTIMPVGAGPHDFQASARQASTMRSADLLIVNGGGFEEGLLAVVEGAESDGVVVHEALSAIDPLEAEGVDPHFFTDPARMVAAVNGILDALVDQVPALDTDDVRDRAAAYVDELEALDAEVERLLEAVPEERRVLVTNHEVFAYFADRYGFEVVGTVIPGGSTEGAAAGDLADLIEVIEHEGVPAVFADTSSPADLARTLAKDIGDVAVVELFSESLGKDGSGGETYVDMIRTNARRVADALG